jgi:L-ribulokinase
MASSKYTIGIDFGTESARAVLVNVRTGEELASAVHQYADSVIDEKLPGASKRLDPDTALQNPLDYVESLKKTIPALLKKAGVKADDVIGVGTDFTACTVVPCKRDGTPLMALKEFRKNPHAWVKLWKHHAAQPEADRLNEVARERGEPWLNFYGGKISSEWLFPKIWQVLDEAPDIYQAADRFIEGADWIIWQLTGVEKRNSCTAGYKAIWDKHEGYPSNDFFKALDPRLEHVVDEKLMRKITPLGQKAGEVTEKMAALTGLRAGTAVAIGNVDAHVSVPAATVTDVGKMVMIMGTSICHMVCGREKVACEGMCGVVEDGILPGLFGYEAGQSGVGDVFAWFVKNAVPASYESEARKRKMDIHQLLEEKAAKLRIGENGILALDWFNGNRSILVNANLTGLLVGMTLGTRPEHIYRALIEATAFGTYKIIENFHRNGVPVNEVYCCGGLPEKNKLLMQIYSDVTGREMRVARSPQAGALGSAMFAAVAAGAERGGYDSIQEAAVKMAALKRDVYRPNAERHAQYAALYREYEILHDYFGRYQNPLMKTLKALRERAHGA